MILIENARIFQTDGSFHKGSIGVDNGVIVTPEKMQGENITHINIDGKMLWPGLVDIHMHGALGYDVSLADAEDIVKLSCYLAQNGVTSFMPTTITDTIDHTIAAISRITEASKNSRLASSIIGVHTEGPFISPKHAGCHDPALIREPDAEKAQAMIDALGKGLLFRITVAPELSGAMELIDSVKSQGGFVSIGHTDADIKTADEAVEHGASTYTHLFNAMRGLHHREPGTVGAALLGKSKVELICDGIHLDPQIVRLTYHMKGAENIIAITDSIPATGLKDGYVVFGGMDVQISGGIARTNNGNLAGSTLRLIDAVQNLYRFSGMSFGDAILCATLVPARALEIDNITGSIESGKRADLIVVDDDCKILMTICRGKIVYNSLDENNEKI